MNYLSELYEKIKPATETDYGFSVRIFERDCAFVEGHKGLLSLSKTEVRVRLKNGSVEIVGEDLMIKYLSVSELAVCGKVLGVQYR